MSDKMRESFEKWYLNHAKLRTCSNFSAESIIALRQGDSYAPDCKYLIALWEAWQAAQSAAVPVVGEPTDAAYKWMIANGVEPLTSLHKLGERLAALLDEDQFSECETLLLTAITAINTFVPVPAAELATLREKAAMVDELRKDAERYRDAPIVAFQHIDQSTHCNDYALVAAAIAGEKRGKENA